jgi:hypothetical protein
MDEAIFAVIFILILGIVGVVIYLSVDFSAYKAKDAGRADQEKIERVQSINYVIDEANTKNQQMYDELKNDVTSTQMNLNEYNRVIQLGSRNGVTTTGLAGTSTTASGGTSITNVGGVLPDMNLLSKVNAVNGLSTTDFTANGMVNIKQTTANPVVKMEGPAGTGSIDVAAGGGLMNITSGARWENNRWVYDKDGRNSTRVLLHDNAITLNTPTSSAKKGEQVHYKEQVRVDNNGMSVRDNSYTGGTAFARTFQSWNPGWNWLHIMRNANDQIYFGADDVNKGIWNVGQKPVSIYTEGIPRMSVTNKGVVKVNRSEADPYPSGWGNGIHSWDGYFNGTVGVGQNGGLHTYMNNDGVYVNREGSAYMDRWGNVIAGKPGFQWRALMSGQDGNIYTRDNGGNVNTVQTGTGHGLWGRNWDWRAGIDGSNGNIWHNGTLFTGQNYVLNGSSKHIIHSPSDGRKALYIAPNMTNDANDWRWDWQNSLELNQKTKSLKVNGGNLCVGNTCISEAQLQKIKQSAGA